MTVYMVVAFIITYLICSVNPAIEICKLKTGEDIRKLRVEGQKPDGIIEHKHFGEIWYFWYFTDLQSDKSGQKLNYTLGAEEDE